MIHSRRYKNPVVKSESLAPEVVIPAVAEAKDDAKRFPVASEAKVDAAKAASPISKGDIVKLVKGRIQKAKYSNPSGNGMLEI